MLQWQCDPARSIGEALGWVPPIEVLPVTGLANILLGGMDVRGARGRRGTNLLETELLATARYAVLRIALRELAST